MLKRRNNKLVNRRRNLHEVSKIGTKDCKTNFHSGISRDGTNKTGSSNKAGTSRVSLKSETGKASTYRMKPDADQIKKKNSSLKPKPKQASVQSLGIKHTKTNHLERSSNLSLNSARIRRNARVNTSSKSKIDSTNIRTGLRRQPKVNQTDKNRASTNKGTTLPKRRTLRSVDREARNSGGQKLVIKYNKPYGLVKPLNTIRSMTTKTVGGVINKIKTDLGRHRELKPQKNIVVEDKIKDNVIVEDITDLDNESKTIKCNPNLKNIETDEDTYEMVKHHDTVSGETKYESTRASESVASKHIIVKHVFVHKLRCLNGTYELNDFMEAVRSFNHESKELYDEGDKEVTFIYVMDNNEKEIDLTKQNNYVGDTIKLYCKESGNLYSIGLVEFV